MNDNVNHSNVKYPSTGQFRNAVHNLKSALTFVGVDENNNAVYDTTKELPLVDFVGTVKVHGTNASLIMFEDQTIYCQSKERLLSFGYDNAGFWEAMQYIETKELFDKVKTQYLKLNNKEPEYPIIIAGEYAGKGIQKGVAVSEVDKFFMIFGVKVGNLWLPIEDYHINKPEDRIFHALDFPSFEVTIDLNNPAEIQNTLISFTESVENECPIGKQLGAVDCMIGEGIVWKPKNAPWCDNSGYWFKVKGEKHSSSKVKKLASVNVEKLNSIKDFVDYAVTESRLEQGLGEIGLDMKKMGEFIKWISQDVFKEESDTMKENNLEMKDIGKELSNKARKWYIEQYNSAV